VVGGGRTWWLSLNNGQGRSELRVHRAGSCGLGLGQWRIVWWGWCFRLLRRAILLYTRVNFLFLSWTGGMIDVRASKLGEHLIKKRNTRNNTLYYYQQKAPINLPERGAYSTLPQQSSLPLRFTNHKPTIIETGTIFF